MKQSTFEISSEEPKRIRSYAFDYIVSDQGHLGTSFWLAKYREFYKWCRFPGYLSLHFDLFSPFHLYISSQFTWHSSSPLCPSRRRFTLASIVERSLGEIQDEMLFFELIQVRRLFIWSRLSPIKFLSCKAQQIQWSSAITFIIYSIIWESNLM